MEAKINSQIEVYSKLFDKFSSLVITKDYELIKDVINQLNIEELNKGTLNTILVAIKPIYKEVESEYMKLLEEFKRR